MEISGASTTQVALSGLQATDDKRAQLNLLLLRKALDEQKRQAADVSRQMEGKGNIVDIRV